MDEIVKAYNNTPHSALEYITPNEAKEYRMEILLLNIKKNKKAKSGIYKAGDRVRKRLKRALFSKGYKQSWSDSIYTISRVSGVNALLDDGETVKLNDLQIVSSTTKEAEKEAYNKELNREEQQSKVQKKVKQEGLNVREIIPRDKIQTRERKPVTQLIDVRYGKVTY